MSFDDLLSLTDVDHIVSTTSLRSPAFRLVKAAMAIDVRSYTRYGSVGPQEVYDIADVGRVYDEFHQGATIALQGLQNFWLPITRFCRDLELTLTHPTQTNAYITPPRSQGLGVHYDTHDVFVLQLSGRKHWEVYERYVEFPLQSQVSPMLDREGREVVLSTDLQPGDCLYIPRGWLHEAYSLDEVSAHLTVGILSYTWSDVLREVFNQTAEEAAFRESVPLGFAYDGDRFSVGLDERIEMLKQWLDNVDRERIGDRLRQRFWTSCTPLLVGQLQQLSLLDALSDRSIVRRRKESICELSVDPERAELTALLGDRELKMPADLQPVMRLILDRDRVRVSDLAEHLDAESRLVLVRRLIREGLVEAISVDGGVMDS